MKKLSLPTTTQQSRLNVARFWPSEAFFHPCHKCLPEPEQDVTGSMCGLSSRMAVTGIGEPNYQGISRLACHQKVCFPKLVIEHWRVVWAELQETKDQYQTHAVTEG